MMKRKAISCCMILLFLFALMGNTTTIVSAQVKQTTISFNAAYQYLNEQFNTFDMSFGPDSIDYVETQKDYIESLQKRINKCTNATKKQKLLTVLVLAEQKLAEYEDCVNDIEKVEDQINRASSELEKAKLTSELDGIKDELNKQFLDYAFYKVEHDLLIKDVVVGSLPSNLAKNNKYANINTYYAIQTAALKLIQNQYSLYKQEISKDEYLKYLEDKLAASKDDKERESWQHELEKYRTKFDKIIGSKNTVNNIYEIGITKLNKGKTIAEKNLYNLTAQNALKETALAVFKYYLGSNFDRALFDDEINILK